ncbi:transmembrane channel-like protein 6 isoform X2 [Salarias fasciatus]|uniref:Transmembrane channel-like protein n=1 Tax=Salarias fasciatus TaxID=181472 RepID=A0A672G1S1_SALFA|nr:transmembrane channel-like protein 6 isoform X2 [Salarias fasciatus]
MAYSVDFTIDTSDTDSDYENLGEDKSGEEYFFEAVRDPGASKRRWNETLEMQVFRESRESLSTSSEGDFETVDALQRHSCSAAALKALSSRQSRAAELKSPSSVVSRRTRRSSQPRPRQLVSHDPPQTFRPIQDHIVQAEVEEISPEGSGDDQLVCSLRGLSASDGTRKLRSLPLSLAEKIKLRQLAFHAETSTIIRYVPCYANICMYISRTWRHCLFGCLTAFSSLQLWHSPMKRLSGRHGTGVLSYFLFLRTLLFLNLLIFIINGLFVVFPQAIHPPPAPPPYDHELDVFPGVWLFTGSGYLSQSLMFYGYYSHTPTDSCPTEESNDCNTYGYSISTAYFFTIVIAFFVICIFLVYSISKSFGKHFQVLKSNGFLAVKVFCSWDFKVSKHASVRLQSEKISTQLKEQLSEMIRGEKSRSCMQRLSRFFFHVATWMICLVCISLSALGIHHLSEISITDDPRKESELQLLLLLSAAVSAINLLLPGLFNLAYVKNTDSSAACVYISVFRNLLLKVSIVGVLCYRWLGRIAVEPESRGLQCWESFVGQELYRLLLMDFICTSLYTLIGEYFWRLCSGNRQRRNRKPVFDIARNVLELIYGQTLTWLGVLFAPLLPAVQITRLFVLFYMKKSSVMVNYRASRKPWRATQMTTLFLSLLCFPSFLGAAVSVTYTVWMIKPSQSCGPFRNLTVMYESSWLWAQKLKKTHPVLSWLTWAYKYLVENPLFLFLTTGVFLIVIYIQTQIVDGQRTIISRLEKHIENEGMDKKFLISKLQELSGQNSPVSSHR